MTQITLFDLPRKGRCACWSLNPWKTRLALNYKRVDYKTEWIEYPEIAPKFQSIGLQPNEDGTAYTIPTVCITNNDGTNSYIMDSSKIATELEARFPETSLHLDSTALQEVEQARNPILLALVPMLMPRTVNNILNDASIPYWVRTRTLKYGMDLGQYEKEKGGEMAWDAAQAPIQNMLAILKRNDGPFFLGETPSYADFVLVALLHFCKCADVDIFERLVGHDQALKDIYAACGPWLMRDDY